MTELTVLGSDRTVALSDCTAADWAGTRLYRSPAGAWLAPAFAGFAAAVHDGPALPDPDDEDAAADLVVRWVTAVQTRDWSDVGGAPLGEADWLDLRTAMVRVGWGPTAAQQAWAEARDRPYAPTLPTAAGWAGGGWVVPVRGLLDPTRDREVEPAFARPVLEARGLLRWAYLARWAEQPVLPAGEPPADVEPAEAGWADALSRLRQDHYTDPSQEEAAELALAVLRRADLGARSDTEAEDEALPDAEVAPATTHASPLVRAAAWFLLRVEADTWLACAYGECQHHWAVEAEEDAFELEEVTELAGYGVANPVDAAHQRRRLLTLAFGDVRDVPLAGAGDVATFVEFYRDWVAAGRSEDDFRRAAEALRDN
jgi:hypothetical protein